LRLTAALADKASAGGRIRIDKRRKPPVRFGTTDAENTDTADPANIFFRRASAKTLHTNTFITSAASDYSGPAWAPSGI
jgi:hypothetical protein